MNRIELRNWRKSRGLTQADLAYILDYHVDQIRKMESGRAPMRNSVALACAAYTMGVRTYDGTDIRLEVSNGRVGH